MLILHSVPPAILAVLKLLGMDRQFHMAADERAAQALAMGGQLP
jgi:hypothetical protein